MRSEGLEIELSDFGGEKATLKGDYMGQVIEIVIGAVPTVLEIRVMCLLMLSAKYCSKAPYLRICSTQ
jgi:hypothetical protein